MHRLIKERLEECLRGSPQQVLPRDIEAHLRTCEECRDELNGFQEQVLLLRKLKAPAEAGPAPGFYARVMERIEAQQRASIWSVFLDSGFARRLAMGSVTVLVLLGAFLVAAENGSDLRPAPEAIIAVDDHPPGLGLDRQRDRAITLVTLATYEE